MGGLSGLLFWFVTISNLESVIGPRSHFKHAALDIVRKVLDVNETRGFVNSRRLPSYGTIVIDGGLGHQSHFVVAVSAV